MLNLELRMLTVKSRMFTLELGMLTFLELWMLTLESKIPTLDLRMLTREESRMTPEA
jgi:hypothetical protein